MLGRKLYECFIFRQPVIFFTKNDTPANFSQKNDNSVKKSVKFSVKKIYQFYVHIVVEIFIHVFMHLYGGEKTGMLKIFLHNIWGCTVMSSCA